MANFKRGKPKAARAGCKMCKPHKLGKGMENELGLRGFGKIRGEAHQVEDLYQAKRDTRYDVAPQDCED